MTYLNQAIKDKIVENAIEKSGIRAEEEEIGLRRADWAEAVRIDSLGGADAARSLEGLHKRITKLESKIPAVMKNHHPAINHERSIFVNVAGMRTRALFSMAPDGSREKKISKSEHVLKAGSPLAKQFEEIEKDAIDLENRKSTLRSNVRAAIDKIRTVKKLLESWPEAKELLPKNLDEARSNLPAIASEDLNKMIGLPSKSKT